MNPGSYYALPMQAQGGVVAHYHGSQREEAPARVRFALDFLTLLATKTQPRAAVNDMSIEVIKGQDLTKAESVALASACHMLNDYFLGRLGPSEWELGTEELPEGIGEGVPVPCVACYPSPPKQTCPLCKGCGKVVVFAHPS